MTPDDLRAAAEVHSELGPGYRDAVVDSFLDKVGKEIDARVDARMALAQLAQNGTRQKHAPDNALRLAIGSLIFGIPISAIAAAVGNHPAGVWGLLVVWIAIAVINVAYALHARPPGRR
jgi:peptidoglycan/LPS O-acetylase OafA/YrhL